MTNSHKDDLMAHVLNAPGLLRLIADYHDGISQRDTPIFGVAAALAAMSALLAGRYVLQMPAGPSSTNVYLLVMGDTGAGKEGVRTAVKQVLKVAGMDDHITSAASPQALNRVLSKYRNVVWPPDEFGRYMRAAGSPNGGQDYMLNTFVMKLYGLAQSSTEATAYAKETDDLKKIERPYLTVLATSTEKSVRDGLTSDAVFDGTLNRFTVLAHDGGAPFLNRRAREMSDDLIAALEPFKPLSVNDGRLSAHGSKQIDIKVDNDAAAALLAFRDEAEAKRETSDHRGGCLLSRAYETALRIAGCAAVAAGDPDAPVLKLSEAEWAISVAKWSVARAMQFIGGIADSPIERLNIDILEYIREVLANPENDLNREGYVPKSQITRKFRVAKRDRDDVLATLVEAGELIHENRGTGEAGGRPLGVFSLPGDGPLTG